MFGLRRVDTDAALSLESPLIFDFSIGHGEECMIPTQTDVGTGEDLSTPLSYQNRPRCHCLTPVPLDSQAL